MPGSGVGVVTLVLRPGGHGLLLEAMREVAIYVASALLTTSAALVQLCSCEAQQCFANQCGTKKQVCYRSVSLDRGEQDKHNYEEVISSRKLAEKLLHIFVSWVCFAGNAPRYLTHE